MSTVNLLAPALSGGIRSTNFFNGRILTAEDLRQEQAAARLQHEQLGIAVGAGIVFGFEVEAAASSTATQPSLHVSKGLAFNLNGDAVALSIDVDVALVRDAAAAAADAGLFVECVPPQETPTATNTGIYLFTVLPASGFEGRAPMVDLGSEVGTACGSRFAVEGVKFRLLSLGLPASFFSDAATLRNRVAHECFGTEDLIGTPFHPTDEHAAYGMIDELRATDVLEACEVPLAVVRWTTNGLEFVDMWSVRRRATRPGAEAPWNLLLAQRRVAEAEAMFLQFQEHLAGIAAQEANLPVFGVKSRFRYLPAGGFVPIGGNSFSVAAFFSGVPFQPADLDEAFVRALLHQSLFVDPIDLANPPPIFVYQPSPPSDYFLFLRGEATVVAPAPSPAPGGGGEPEPSTPPTGEGKLEVGVRFDEKGKKPLFTKDEPLDVWAQSGTRKFTPDMSLALPKIPGAENVIRLVFKKLPAGSYTVGAQASGFMKATKSATITNGVTTRVEFVLTRGKGGIREREPGRRVGAEWIGPGWYDEAVIIDEHWRFPWPPPGDPERFGPVVNPPPEVEGWATGWAEKIQERFPNYAVDPAEARLYLDANHTPAVSPVEEYAYLVFGNGGAYAPVVLTFSDRATGEGFGASAAGLSWLDRQRDEARLEEAGLGDLDVLAAAPVNLIAEALEIDPANAATFLKEAQTKAAEMNDNVKVLAGVDDRVAGALGDKTPEDVANMTPDELKDLAGAAGVEMTDAKATRIVGEARKHVDKDRWSLDAEHLGLDEGDRARLNEKGIQTQGGYAKASNEKREEALGADAAAALTGRIDAGKTAAAKNRKAAKPLAAEGGLSLNQLKTLARMGIGTFGGAANADLNVLTGVFGDVGAAEEFRNSARNKIL